MLGGHGEPAQSSVPSAMVRQGPCPLGAQLWGRQTRKQPTPVLGDKRPEADVCTREWGTWEREEGQTGLAPWYIPSVWTSAWHTVGAQLACLVTARSEATGEKYSRQTGHHAQMWGGAEQGVTRAEDQKQLPRTRPQEAREGEWRLRIFSQAPDIENTLLKFMQSVSDGFWSQRLGGLQQYTCFISRPCTGSCTLVHNRLRESFLTHFTDE